ncbi:MAG TPA: MFS transporter [Chlamydiales bacterium]|nr:MFS transporter [Chlamydiales bacterium]
MKKLLGLSLNKIQKYVIFAITFGNVLEWYDFYLYIIWSPVLSKQFFGQEGTSFNLLFIMAFYAIGFIFRPLGGVFFGRLGDRVGRKKAFISSLAVMAGSTFLMGFIPTYDKVGVLAPILLAFLRIAQSFPSGGELPGAFCYLYEAGTENRKFTTSFAGFGNQIGAIVAAIEGYFLAKHFPVETYPNLGWRTAFIIGGIIGLFGIFLRARLQETESFLELSAHQKITRAPIWKAFQGYWGKIVRGGIFGAMQTVCYHFIAVIFPIYFFRSSGMSSEQGLLTTIILLTITTLPLPFYGLLAERFGVLRLAIVACLCVIALLYPLHIAISHPGWNTLFIIGLIALCVSCLTAIWPYFITHLFPTHVRYTCVGLSFNIADGVIGGLTSLTAFYLINVQKNFSLFTWLVLASCLVSVASCAKIKILKEDNQK